MKPEQRQEITAEIQKFFADEREEEIGIVAAERLLTFFLESVGKRIYNSALDDARSWLTRHAEDLELEFDQLYQP